MFVRVGTWGNVRACNRADLVRNRSYNPFERYAITMKKTTVYGHKRLHWPPKPEKGNSILPANPELQQPIIKARTPGDSKADRKQTVAYWNYVLLAQHYVSLARFSVAVTYVPQAKFSVSSACTASHTCSCSFTYRNFLALQGKLNVVRSLLRLRILCLRSALGQGPVQSTRTNPGICHGQVNVRISASVRIINSV